MYYPVARPRRLRSSANMRRLVRENHLRVDDLIYPFFITGGRDVQQPVESMPGVYRFSTDRLLIQLKEVQSLGIPGILLFGIPDSKDAVGSGAYDANGIIQQAVRAIKDKFPELLVITDVCLCEYTDHGHCGIVHEGKVLNDPTLELLARTAVSHAQSGADIIAPSDMMDGRVRAIREALDEHGYADVPIMSYSVKYASAFYGPFREAADSAPQFGDRKTYQMDPPNLREALREVEQDITEGADMVIVKPAMAYMDVIAAVRENFDGPLAAYNVSGEYSMIKAAARLGWIDEQKTTMELLTGLKRAGADIIITYHAPDVVRWLKEDG
ncbi:porphobilinogen synthase [Desulfallas thermosapovorans]|uniref:Delta-aminolevulinic acid dehydratase n=1 Tax=Desulfallas thermosapovorans DSM 6562 TaxID=1121431 RepID=A0A5S4ZQC6_9FIRM|nr:porphobilinogen synthase [Desulfallas thermosapovorans]TYO94994.1 porphobilinogen synthase [Desulfallas thermosapovorans DSM 6562]